MMLMIPPNNGLFDMTKTLTAIAEKVEKQGPRDAELVPGKPSGWYIVCTQAGQDGVAAGHLIGRRFGVYQPLYPNTTVVRGRKVTRMLRMFPGYLFIFAWDIDRHVRRILAVPGVSRLLSIEDKPVRVPDALIDDIRAAENRENPIRYTVEMTKVRKRRKKRRIETWEEEVEATADDIVAVSSKSYWFQDPGPSRIGLLEKALGLPQGGLTESNA